MRPTRRRSAPRRVGSIAEAMRPRWRLCLPESTPDSVVPACLRSRQLVWWTGRAESGRTRCHRGSGGHHGRAAALRLVQPRRRLALAHAVLPQLSEARFSVFLELRWRRQLVSRRWTYPHKEAGTSTSRAAAAGADPTPRPREPALGLSTDRRRAQAARACGLSDHCPQGAEPR
jgi:hypothetical protein